jgi:hypothetical protein
MFQYYFPVVWQLYTGALPVLENEGSLTKKIFCTPEYSVPGTIHAIVVQLPVLVVPAAILGKMKQLF